MYLYKKKMDIHISVTDSLNYVTETVKSHFSASQIQQKRFRSNYSSGSAYTKDITVYLFYPRYDQSISNIFMH